MASTSSNFNADQKSQIYKQIDEELLVFFVHYEKKEIIDDIDLSALKFLRENGYKVKVITNNHSLHTNNFDPIFAKNLGRDLGVYRDLVQTLFELGYKGKVILLNNSIAWMPSKQLLQAMDYLENNCGSKAFSTLVESFQPRRHHQSFAFGLDFQSTFVSTFFNHIKNTKLKRTLITFGELRISNFALKQGMKIESMIKYEDILLKFKTGATRNGDSIQIQKLIHLEIPLNPTQHFWSEIISLGFPGYKKNLLSSNPAKLSHLPKDYMDIR